MRLMIRLDAVSAERIGWIVAMSEMVASTIRPPCCGFSDVAAVGVGLAFPCPPGVHAVTSRRVPAKPAMSVLKRFCVMPLSGSFPMRELRESRQSPSARLANVPALLYRRTAEAVRPIRRRTCRRAYSPIECAA